MQETPIKPVKCEMYHDNFQNFKRYSIPKAQLVIADIPYNLGVDAYASNPVWYEGGDNKNGESDKAKKAFFNTDYDFRIAEYMHFCSKLLVKEPKERGKMIFDWFEWKRDNRKDYPKCHPTQKPVGVLKRLIEIFTDPGDVVIDPVAGSGSTLRAAYELGRSSYGFEVDRKFFTDATQTMLKGIQPGT